MMAFDVPPRGTAPATTRGQPGHKHPAAVYAYVATGEVISRLGDGPERRYRTGEAWSEKPNEAHYIVNASSTEPARVVVTFIAPKTAKSLSEPLDAMKMR
jgi:quercetin dioxygenase-like cupin family protein